MTIARSPFEVCADLMDPVPRVDPWDDQVRPEQRPPPGDWLIWIYLAGRGAGKSRSAGEFVKSRARARPGSRIALVARTFADGRDTMVEGQAGLLAIIPDDELRGGARDKAWNRSLGELFLANGSRFKLYSSEKPAALRGPQHDDAWVDEAASLLDAHLGDSEDTTWSNLMLGLRLGRDPRCVVSTTPKPVKLLRGTRERPGILAGSATVVTRGSTYDNLDNLAPTFRAQVLDRYEGTRLGRQELHAEMLEDVEGALWSHALIDQHRVMPGYELGTAGGLVRVVVGVDPAATSGPDADETGIVVVGKGADGRGYVLDDRSCRASPADWGRAVVQAYRDHNADVIVAEVNNGGEMVRHVLHTVDQRAPVRMVHASRGKRTRAEPVAAMYEQGKWSHIGSFPELEDQMTAWAPDSPSSPDRMDACLVAGTKIMTARGDVPIDDVGIGDVVLTRAGWRPVTHGGMTDEKAQIITVVTNDGRSLTGTTCHPVWVEGRGFSPLGSLVWGDRLQTCPSVKPLSFRVLSTPASLSRYTSTSGTTTGPPVGVDGTHTTVRSGRQPTDPSPRATTSTIGTGIRSTTARGTSSASHLGSTRKNTLRSSLTSGAAIWTWPARLLRSGTDLTRDGLGTASTDVVRGRAAFHNQWYARTAARQRIASFPSASVLATAVAGVLGLWPTGSRDTRLRRPAPSVEESSVRAGTSLSRRPAPVSVVRRCESGTAPVFNLEVAGQPEYFANGLLVHNCVWAAAEVFPLSGDVGQVEAADQRLSTGRRAR